MDENPILVDRRAGYRVITLNRPQRLNAFTDPDAPGAGGGDRRGRAGRDLPRAAADRRRPRVLVRPGPQRARDCRRARWWCPARRWRNTTTRWCSSCARCRFPVVCAVNGIAAGAGLQHRARLRHRAGGALGDLPAGVRAARPRARRRRHLAAAAPGRPGAGARARAARRAAVGREGRAMGPDLEGGRRRRADDGGREALRAFRHRADVRPRPDQARARRRRGQRSCDAARSRTQIAARGRQHAGLRRRRAGVSRASASRVFTGKR